MHQTVLTTEIDFYPRDSCTNDPSCAFTGEEAGAACVATTVDANPTTFGHITTAAATTITELITTNARKTTANAENGPISHNNCSCFYSC